MAGSSLLVKTLRAMDDPERRSRLMLADFLRRQHAARPWYDSMILDRLSVALKYLAEVSPAGREALLARLQALHVALDTQLEVVADFLPPEMFADLCDTVTAWRDEDLDPCEAQQLGRLKRNNDPLFLPAQSVAQAYVEAKTGRKLAPSFSMFLRYGIGAKLPLHMDSPDSQYSLGICLGRSGSWPIHCSKVVPTVFELDAGGWTGAELLADPDMGWSTADPGPNEAVFFASANQWHFRPPLEGESHAPYQILYFSFVDPAACNLFDYRSWGALGIPELDELATAYAIAHTEAERLRRRREQRRARRTPCRIDIPAPTQPDHALEAGPGRPPRRRRQRPVA